MYKYRTSEVKYNDMVFVFREEIGIDDLDRTEINFQLGGIEEEDTRRNQKLLARYYFTRILTQLENQSTDFFPISFTDKEALEECYNNLFYNPEYSSLYTRLRIAIDNLELKQDEGLEPAKKLEKKD